MISKRIAIYSRLSPAVVPYSHCDVAKIHKSGCNLRSAIGREEGERKRVPEKEKEKERDRETVTCVPQL